MAQDWWIFVPDQPVLPLPPIDPFLTLPLQDAACLIVRNTPNDLKKDGLRVRLRGNVEQLVFIPEVIPPCYLGIQIVEYTILTGIGLWSFH